MQTDAIVLAGGRTGGLLKRRGETDYKCFLSTGKGSLLEAMVNSLKGCDLVSSIHVLAPSSLKDLIAIENIDSVHGKDLPVIEGIVSLLEHLGRESNHRKDRYLICASDLPFVSSRGIRDFLKLCPGGINLCLPVIEKKDFFRRFPGTIKFPVPLKEGSFTAGGVLLLQGQGDIGRLKAFMQKLFDARKNLPELLGMLGRGFVWRFVTHSLSVSDIEKRIEVLSGMSCRAVRGCDPALAFDIDNILHFIQAKRCIRV
ncbi:MAG: NTP transferase domain-containing protein [Candidatus Eremiobacteraeota bacterium]|nr:NTP transferase domain-containing protein [Candidatus Eremiobacteraeota bacterium]